MRYFVLAVATLGAIVGCAVSLLASNTRPMPGPNDLRCEYGADYSGIQRCENHEVICYVGYGTNGMSAMQCKWKDPK
jgi:hypothetical protein